MIIVKTRMWLCNQITLTLEGICGFEAQLFECRVQFFPPAYGVQGGGGCYVFTGVCLLTRRWAGLPHLHPIKDLLPTNGPMSFLGGIPQWLVPGPFLGVGYPSPRWAVPQSQVGVTLVPDGVYSSPRQGGTLVPGREYPSPRWSIPVPGRGYPSLR